jgi:hypothetical protein
MEFTMNKKEQSYFDEQYLRHLRALKLQGKSDATISSYGRAVRRLAKYFGSPSSSVRL